MSCTDGTCGTGGWTGPQPGDPDNNITLAARTTYGGVLVSWSYPLLNGHAVAYTEVFRGTTPDSATAVLLDQSGGSNYFDRTNPEADTQYFYWIEVVSIHGTRGARIGPAMAVARPQVAQTLESLTGLIDSSLLAQTLKTDIAGITLNNQKIQQEIQDRLASNQVLQDALAAVQGEVDEAMTYILNETTQRKDADGAVVTQVNAIAAGLNDAQAAITEERTVRVSQTDALARDVNAMVVRLDDAEGAILEEKQARIDADDLQVSSYTALSGRMDTAEGAITDISSLTLAPESALATKLTTLSTDVGDAKSAIEDLDTSLTDGTHALASSVKTVEATVNGDVATGQVGLVTQVDTLDQTVNSMWYAKVQVNGLVGGFGVSNDGSVVDAGFDVDRFWIGRTGPDMVKPFIVDGGVVYIDKARIRDADIDSLKIAGSAVTVPITVRSDAIVKGSGKNQWKTLAKGYIKLTLPGIVYAHCICSQWYPQGSQEWGMRIKVGGVQGSTVGGAALEVTPVIAQSIGLTEGVHAVEIEWWGANSNVYIGNTELFIMGAKR